MKAISLYVEPVNYTPQGSGLLCKVMWASDEKSFQLSFAVLLTECQEMNL